METIYGGRAANLKPPGQAGPAGQEKVHGGVLPGRRQGNPKET